MAHTTQNKTRLIHRVRRLRGQLDAVEKALKEDAECSRVLLTLAACRGSLDALMCEIMEGHVRFHVLNPKRNPTPEQKRATEDVIAVIRRYLK